MTAITTEPCPGPCNRDWRANHDQPATDLKPVPGDPVWCEPDRRRIRRALNDIPQLHLALEGDMAARARADVGTTFASRTRPTPSAQVDLQDEVLRHLRWIEDEVRRARPGMVARGSRPDRIAPSAGRWAVETLPTGMYGPPRLLSTSSKERTPTTSTVVRPTDRALVTTVRFLDAHLDWLLDQEDPGSWAGQRILSYHARMRTSTASGVGLTRRTQRCPRCKVRSLVQEPGAEYIQCESCGRLISLDEYADLCAPDRRDV